MDDISPAETVYLFILILNQILHANANMGYYSKA